MTAIKLTEPERDLLARAAAAEDGFADAFEGEAKLTPGLVRRRLMTRTSVGESADRFMVTAKGRSAIDLTQGRDSTTKVDAPEKTARTKRNSKKATAAPSPRKGKVSTLVDLLKRPSGATITVMMEATGWQAHSVRGAISGAIKKTLGLEVISQKTDAGRSYRIAAEANA